jgi:hypothetical protein
MCRWFLITLLMTEEADSGLSEEDLSMFCMLFLFLDAAYSAYKTKTLAAPALAAHLLSIDTT